MRSVQSLRKEYNMKDSFLRVAGVSPKLKVADVVYNREEILKHIENASKLGVKLLVFPELFYKKP